MNLLLLAAGSGESFRDAGHQYPKNLVEIEGQPILQRSIENVRPMVGADGRLVVIVRREENLRYHTDAVARLVAPEVKICQISGATAGAACSALLAIDSIDETQPLVIANGDQVIEADLTAAIADFQRRGLDAGTIVFEDVHPRWSFVKCNADGLVIEAAEKCPISRLATAGIYYFARGADFVRAAMRMILKDAHHDGIFFVCPVFNEQLLENARIGVFQIPRNAYFSLATPQGAVTYTDHLRQRSR